MSAREYRPPREIDTQTRHRNGGRPTPSERAVREEAVARRERERHEDGEPSMWHRVTHTLAGKVFHR